MLDAANIVNMYEPTDVFQDELLSTVPIQLQLSI
jgi:hypothetical protein